MGGRASGGDRRPRAADEASTGTANGRATPAIFGVTVSDFTMMWKLPVRVVVWPGPLRCHTSVTPAPVPGKRTRRLSSTTRSASIRIAGRGPCIVSMLT
ncbi:hypothetical protein [Corynebacterium bovis]|uniref:hypothetical protein n=1 Tax=Corynebacterium bovis TaxID=36808 RepID=UPI00163ADAC7|nr:hypothetical protein [Corynebacterium bovis]